MLNAIRHKIVFSARLLLALTLMQCLFVGFEFGASDHPAADSIDQHHLSRVERTCTSADCTSFGATDKGSTSEAPHADNCDHCCHCLGHAHGSHFAVLPTNHLMLVAHLPAVHTGESVTFSPPHLDAIHRPPIV